MNSKQLGIVLGILVLCIAGVFLVKSRTANTVKQPANVLGQKAFPELGENVVNTVGSIVIRDKEGEVTITRKDGTWRVEQRGDYPADFTKVSNFLRDVWGLKIAEAQVVGESKLGVLELKEPGGEAAEGTGTLVELKNEAGEGITRFVLGKTFEAGAQQTGPMGMSFGASQGRFLKTKDSGDNVWLISESLTGAAPSPEDWVNKEFIKVQKIVEIDYTDPENPAESWRLTRPDANADFQLADAAEDEKLDSSKAAPLKNALTSPSFKDLVVDADPAATGLDKPRSFVLKTAEGFTYDVKIGNATDEGDVHMTVAVEGEFPTEYVPEPVEAPETGEAEAAEGAEGTEAADDAATPEKTEEEKKQEEEERKRKEEEFQTELKRKQDKLAAEKALEGTVYIVNKWSVDSLLKKRSELLQQEEAATPDGVVPNPADPTSLPNGTSSAAPQGSRPRVTAVTPPISIPLPPDQEEAADEDAATDADVESDGEDAPDEGTDEGEMEEEDPTPTTGEEASAEAAGDSEPTSGE